MSKTVQRLLMFCIALPLVVFIVLAPYKNHLLMNIVVIGLCSMGAVEMAALFKKKGAWLTFPEAAVLGALFPTAMTLFASFRLNENIIFGIMILGASWALVSRVFSKEELLQNALEHIGAAFAVLLYPGFFLSWVIRMTFWENAAFIILMFLLMVISNDSAAWACGMLFGKNNKGMIPASPNKSIAGYTGGLIASMLVGLFAAHFFPEILESRIGHVPKLVSGILVGLVTGVAGSLGDLTESVMKRSAKAKDSGFIIPGRGGVLDSIDSIAVAAPVFYVVYWFFFNH